MEPNSPDFARLITTLQHAEPDRVPLAEVAVDYAIMSQFLGRPVTDDDVAGQVEFWTRAGYDYSLFTMDMMCPGGVTPDSQISKVMSQTLARDDTDDQAWNLWKKPRIFSEKDFETFPWEQAARLDFSKIEAAQAYLPDKMKIIVASGKIFTLSWMAMGFENCGGYCLGSGNSVPVWAKIENYRAMVDTVLRQGHYPINL